MTLKRSETSPEPSILDGRTGSWWFLVAENEGALPAVRLARPRGPLLSFAALRAAHGPALLLCAARCCREDGDESASQDAELDGAEHKDGGKVKVKWTHEEVSAARTVYRK